jgi:proteasome assembly chaperone (PAC2) family protein
VENENIIWMKRPDLVKPYLIMAFTGWGNAGDVASSVIIYLTTQLGAEPFGGIRPDQFYFYESIGSEMKRPIVNIENGRLKSFDYLTTNFWFAKDKYGEHDVIIVSGPEPETNWPKFSDALVDLAKEYHVEKIVALGGTFDAVPHTVPPIISAVATSQALLEESQRFGFEAVNYQGPSAIHSALMVAASSRNLPMLSLWAHTPHYVQVTNFMGSYALMKKLVELLGLEIDLETARKDSEYLCKQLDQAIEKKPELKEYLTTLEVEYREGHSGTLTPINRKIVNEIEDILKD